MSSISSRPGSPRVRAFGTLVGARAGIGAFIATLLIQVGWVGALAKPGDMLWEFPIPGAGHPAIGKNGVAYTVLPGGRMTALRASDGERLIGVTAPTNATVPMLTLDGKQLIIGGDGLVRAYDASTGADLWTDPNRPSYIRMLAEVPGGPIVAVTPVGSRIYGLDRRSGMPIWTNTFGLSYGDQADELATGFGMVFLARTFTITVRTRDTASFLTALDAENGRNRWFAPQRWGDKGGGLSVSDSGSVFGRIVTGCPSSRWCPADGVGWISAATGLNLTNYSVSDMNEAVPPIHAPDGVQLLARGTGLGPLKNGRVIGSPVLRSYQLISVALAADGTVYGATASSLVSQKILPSVTNSPRVVWTGNNLSIRDIALGPEGNVYVMWRGGIRVFEGTAGLARTSWPKQHGDAGNTRSGAGELDGPPEILFHPESVERSAGQGLRLTGWAKGAFPITYQWLHNGLPIPGANSWSYSAQRIPLEANGRYELMASNHLGTARSAASQVRVVYRLPEFRVQPEDKTLGWLVFWGESFNCALDGADDESIVWYHNHQEVARGTSALQLSTIAPMSWPGDYWAVASNAAGSVTSRVAHLTQLVPISVSVHGSGAVVQNPVGQQLPLGTRIEFQAVPKPGYHWRRWVGSIQSTNATVSLELTNSISLTAYFSQPPGTVRWTAAPPRTALPPGVIWEPPCPVVTSQGLVVVAGSSGTIQAYDDIGALVWQFTDPPGWLDGGPIPYAVQLVADRDGQVFACNQANRLFAFDAATGRLIWRSPLYSSLGWIDGWYHLLLDPNGSLAAVTTRSFPLPSTELIRMDQGTGAWLSFTNLAPLPWPYPALVWSMTPTSSPDRPFDLAPLAAKTSSTDGLYLEPTGTRLAAYRTGTSTPVWEIRRGSNSVGRAQAVIDRHRTVYWGNGDGTVIAANLATGTTRWSFQVASEPIHALMLGEPNVLYCATDSRLMALDLITRTVRWQYPLSQVGARHLTMLPDGGVVVAFEDESLTCVEGEGPLARAIWPKSNGSAGNSGLPGFSPVFDFAPTTRMVAVGSTVRLVARVDAEPPATLQWLFKNRPLDGATQSSLVLDSFSAEQAGDYAVVATNGLGPPVRVNFRLLANDVPVQRWPEITFSLPAGRTARIEQAPSLRGPWHAVSEPIVGPADGQWLDPEPLGAVDRFYRLPEATLTQLRLVNGVSVLGHSGQRVRIEFVDASTGWENWRELATDVAVTTEAFRFIDRTQGNSGERFYRIQRLDPSPRSSSVGSPRSK